MDRQLRDLRAVDQRGTIFILYIVKSASSEQYDALTSWRILGGRHTSHHNGENYTARRCNGYLFQGSFIQNSLSTLLSSNFLLTPTLRSLGHVRIILVCYVQSLTILVYRVVHLIMTFLLE